MGVHPNVSATAWPTQGGFLGKRVRVCFHYDVQHVVLGTVVRDDVEEPFVTIISLDTGRVVLATECQYSELEADA